MLQFIATNILMISLGVILYITVRTLPRIDDSQLPEKKGVLERWIASEMPEKIDAALNSFLAKFLRRLKVSLLKIDNSLGRHLRKIKIKGNGDEKTKTNIDFKEISGKNNRED